MKKFVFFMIVMLMFLSVVSIAFADSTYPNYQWRYRMQIQQQGDQNAQVGAIQRVLHQLNYGINVDWNFGSTTKAKVKSFQTNSSLTADGIVGGRTWEALQDYLSKTRRDSNGFDYFIKCLLLNTLRMELMAHGGS